MLLDLGCIAEVTIPRVSLSHYSQGVTVPLPKVTAALLPVHHVVVLATVDRSHLPEMSIYTDKHKY